MLKHMSCQALIYAETSISNSNDTYNGYSQSSPDDVKRWPTHKLQNYGVHCDSNLYFCQLYVHVYKKQQNKNSEQDIQVKEM